MSFSSHQGHALCPLLCPQPSLQSVLPAPPVLPLHTPGCSPPPSLCPVSLASVLPMPPLTSVTHLQASRPTLFPSLDQRFPTCPVSPQLGLDAANGSAPQPRPPPPQRLQALLEDLLDAQKVLQDVDVLSALALLLPQGACAGRAPGPPGSGPGGAANGKGAGGGTGSNTTAEEGAPSAAAPASSDALQGQCSAFVQLWAGLQPILCGNNR